MVFALGPDMCRKTTWVADRIFLGFRGNGNISASKWTLVLIDGSKFISYMCPVRGNFHSGSITPMGRVIPPYASPRLGFCPLGLRGGGHISGSTHTLLTFDIAISISCVCSQDIWSFAKSIVHIGREMAPQASPVWVPVSIHRLGAQA